MNKDNLTLISFLELEKNMTNYYSNFLLESSNDYLYENIFSMMEDTSDMAREIYNYLYDKTYSLEEVNANTLNKEINRLENIIK